MVFPPTPDGSLPDTYQQADVERIFSILAAGESCAVVGVGSVGKSNLLQFMTRNDVKQRYLAENAPYCVMVLLNPHHMIHPQAQALALTGDSWAGYEIMLNRLRRTLAVMLYENLIPDGHNEKGDVAERIAARYNLLFESQALLTQTGIRQLEDSVTEVLSLERRMRIVFMFDEFEEFLRLPDYFWQSLRGVRDDYKQRVMYLCASRRNLSTLADERFPQPESALRIEGFVELFHGFTHYLSRLDSNSAQASIERLERRYHVALAADLERVLIYTSGRHHGLLRRGFRVAARLSSASNLSDETFLDLLLQNRGIRQECQSIYDSLSAEEQAILRQIVHLHPVNEESETWSDLSAKQLIAKTDAGRPVLTIPVFAMYIRDNLTQT